eukprot:10412555-Prorocentrum_lima.AAC.1
MGNIQGGWLRVESREGRTLPPHTAPGLEAGTKGSNRVTKGKWLNFGGTKWHAMTPTTRCILPL